MPSWRGFEERASAAQELDALWRDYVAAMEALGYHAVDWAVTRARSLRPADARELELLHHLATVDWTEQYIERGYQSVDRVTDLAVRSLLPFSYAQARATPPGSALQREMEGEVVARDIRSGLDIPLHGPGGVFAVIGLGSRLTEAERKRAESERLPDTLLISAVFNARAQALLGASDSSTVNLTDRERECLLWASQGKTAWETSVILSLGESTVRKHLASAAAKLGARTRAQAVAAALAQGNLLP